MAPAGQQLHAQRDSLIFNLRQDASSDRDNRVRREHQSRPDAGRDGRSLSRASRSAWPRGSSPCGTLVDVGGHDLIGHHADAREQVEACAGLRKRGRAARAALAQNGR